MNIFENLIDELEKENLIERTGGSKKDSENEIITVGEDAIVSADNSTDFKSESVRQSPVAEMNNNKADQINEPVVELKKSDLFMPKENSVSSSNDSVEPVKAPDVKASTGAAKPINKAEFYKRRATEEVAGLQMVEHVFSGIERQQMKMVPKPYDDLQVKKALHGFLQVSDDVNSPDHARTEFELMQETESWYSALSHRDKQISITNLRRYCETAKPVLSSPALLALARFYRNSPYSEAVRSKFDLIVTRLFSKDLPGETREHTFERNELIKHLSELYAEWESISFYEGEEDQSEIVLTAFKFEDFIGEADKSESFDELIKNDFFNRLRSFKESTGEKFFSPLITAAAVECNISIGNRYVRLLEQEREKGEIEKLENKYGFLHDQVISDATSKSLQLVHLLKTKTVEVAQPETTVEVKKELEPTAEKTRSRPPVKSSSEKSNNPLGVNKWLLAAAAIIVCGSVLLYTWSSRDAAPERLSQDVKLLNIDGPTLNAYIRDARVGNNTFFAIVLPAWNNLDTEKKEEILKKIVSVGGEKGFKNVHLLSADGKSVGTVADNVVEVKN